MRQRRQKRGGGKALGRAQHDPRAALTHVSQRARDRAGIHARRDHRGRMPTEHKPAVLVCHQRNQRRDHDRQPIGGDARELVAQALAATGGHHHQAVATGERSGHRLTLPGPELIQAKMREQRVGIEGPVVAALRGSVEVDAVQAAERALRGGLVIVDERRA